MANKATMGALPELLPVVVIIHEAWHTPTHYSVFIDALTTLGYPVTCPQLLTSHTDSEHTGTFNDDCSMIYQLVFDLSCDGNDVLVLAHGMYGSFVATEILHELSKTARDHHGHSGGVIGLINVAGFLPDRHETLKHSFGTGGWPESIHRHSKHTSALDLHNPGVVLYNDLGNMEREHWASHLHHFTADPNHIVIDTTPAWKTIPTTYIVCEEDDFIPPELQRSVAEKAHVDVAEIECAGHSPIIGKSDELVELVGVIVCRLYDPEQAAYAIESSRDISHYDRDDDPDDPHQRHHPQHHTTERDDPHSHHQPQPKHHNTEQDDPHQQHHPQHHDTGRNDASQLQQYPQHPQHYDTTRDDIHQHQQHRDTDRDGPHHHQQHQSHLGEQPQHHHNQEGTDHGQTHHHHQQQLQGHDEDDPHCHQQHQDHDPNAPHEHQKHHGHDHDHHKDDDSDTGSVASAPDQVAKHDNNTKPFRRASTAPMF